MAYAEQQSTLAAGQTASPPMQVLGILRAIAIDGSGTSLNAVVQLLTPFGWADIRNYRAAYGFATITSRRLLFAAQQMPIGSATYRVRLTTGAALDIPLTYISQQYEGSV